MERKTTRAGTFSAIAAMLVILAGAAAYAYLGLRAPGEPMPIQGWIALGLGVVFSLIVGIGLMALLFYSSRRGYDEPAHFQPDNRRDRN
jgi:FtsH-binding integral membrane protein